MKAISDFWHRFFICKGEARAYHRPAPGRVVLRVSAALLSLVVLCAAAGLLYTENLLNQINRTEETISRPGAVSGQILDSAAVSRIVSSTASVADPKSPDESMDGYTVVQDIAMLNDPDVYNVLLLGADKFGLGDSTMIVSINSATKKIHITSLMRAMYVNIPEYGFFLLNHAYPWGGIQLLMQTIENNFRIQLHDYIIVDFNSFPKVINAVGGVTMTLSAQEAEYMTIASSTGTVYSAGAQWLDGMAALDYARDRTNGSDFTRTERQRNIITAVMKKALSGNLGQLNKLATTLVSMVKTNLSNSQILSLVAKVGTYAKYEISQKMLPVENDTSDGHGVTFYGIIRVPYYTDHSQSVEAYNFDYVKNVQEMHAFIRS